MRIIIMAILLVVATVNVTAQNVDPSQVTVGDVLVIGHPDARIYKHIDFPRANFIIKKGGIADFKGLVGSQVLVTAVKENKKGTLIVKIKKANGKKFFNSHAVIRADLKNALESGELSMR
ncbi:hypothetical protein [Allomuricauda sp. F6463D]|uniref:hypothetical protein n=1 Tax=Allomuricauda sp. F6463D TaxID=2926409 RepID=UPI001FF45269|nr:hypothetical protein [Muricauda sp. F6463D]MCK0161255.1 hypothetical protein [Muricauda sp. F6463D]